ncbi:MAG TPA: DUF5658 family protein [Syntrophales bacterium]|nr:DUF5658 family protein [Syntrophales bacterium]HPQ45627.1 DUF5658 family protein [Syntrophales bacterium]
MKRKILLNGYTLSVGTPQHLKWLNGIIIAVVVLNILDLLFTLLWSQLGLMREVNILMGQLLYVRPVLFALVKIVLVSLSLYLLWRYRKHPFAVVGLFSVFTVYYSVLLHHLRFASFLSSI